MEEAQESRQIIYGRLLSFSMNLYTQSAFEMISPMKLVVAEDESNGDFLLLTSSTLHTLSSSSYCPSDFVSFNSGRRRITAANGGEPK